MKMVVISLSPGEAELIDLGDLVGAVAGSPSLAARVLVTQLA